jgi:hypothetical protein
MRPITAVSRGQLARESSDNVSARRELTSQHSSVRHLEVSEIKARTDRTPKEGVRSTSHWDSGEPRAGWHHILQDLPLMDLSTDAHELMTSLMEHVQLKRPSRVKVPHLIGTNAMKSGKVACLKKVIDPCRCVAVPLKSRSEGTRGDEIGGAIGFFKESPFRMRS